MIVYYDGVCALCNRFVQWALRNDPQGKLRFAALEGPHGTRLRLDYPETRAVDSIVVRDGEQVFVRSDAILKITSALGGIWALAVVARALPRPLRDWAYDAVARRRYRRFGRFDACPIPAPDVRDRFLDA